LLIDRVYRLLEPDRRSGAASSHSSSSPRRSSATGLLDPGRRRTWAVRRPLRGHQHPPAAAHPPRPTAACSPEAL